MESSKEELIPKIKEWIKIDSEITEMKKEIKTRSKRKKELTEDLVHVMKKNDIDCFDINGGALLYKRNKVKKPISGKTLASALQDFYKDDPKLAETLTTHLLETREEQVKETICRKILKIK
jgi:hypothetical protein